MNIIKKIAPFLIVALVVGIGSYAIGRNSIPSDQGASVYGIKTGTTGPTNPSPVVDSIKASPAAAAVNSGKGAVNSLVADKGTATSEMVTKAWCTQNGGQWLGNGHCFITFKKPSTTDTDPAMHRSVQWCKANGGTPITDKFSIYIGCFFLVVPNPGTGSAAMLKSNTAPIAGTVTQEWCTQNGGQWLGNGHCIVTMVSTPVTGTPNVHNYDWCVSNGGTPLVDRVGGYLACYFLKVPKPDSKSIK